jgi:hypothetical protein
MTDVNEETIQTQAISEENNGKGKAKAKRKPKAPPKPPADPPTHKQKLRAAVRFFYDLQKLRIQSGNRGGPQAEHAEAALDDVDKAFLTKTSTGLDLLEKEGLHEIARLLKGVPIYETWLKDQKGIGPTMAGVLLSEINIENCNTASQLWSFCGVGLKDGKIQRRVKGQKANYNPWLKSKVLKVIGDCLLRANSPWRSFYDNYKHRKQNTILEVCVCCNGSGRMKVEEEKPKGHGQPSATSEPPRNQGQPKSSSEPSQNGQPREYSEPSQSGHPGVEGEPRTLGQPNVAGEPKKERTAKCFNCNGTGGPAPWGRSDAHRHQASIRFMCKQFLLELWRQWRTIEGLEVRPSYFEQYLGGHKSG